MDEGNFDSGCYVLFRFTSIFLITIFYQLLAIGPDTPLPPTSPLQKSHFKPWFTGSLLSGSGVTLPKGMVNPELYLFVTHFTGHYNSDWKGVSTSRAVSVNPLLDLVYGLTDNMDLTILPALSSNFAQGASDTRVNDFRLYLGFQLSRNNALTWKPDIRLVLKTTYPTGHYQHLNPHKNGTDATGLGSYRVGFGLNFQKLRYLHNSKRLLRMRLNLDYHILSDVHVHGFNVYGGGYGTKAKVYPGGIFSTILSLEYTFTQHWIGAIDMTYLTEGATHFSGYPGVTAAGTLANLSFPRKQQFSLAPAIEYAFSKNLGLIFGPWFTIAGKNSPRFISYVIALNYIK